MIPQALLILSVLVSTAAYDPTDVFLINCGSTYNLTDNSGRSWTTESPEVMPSNSFNVSFSSETSFPTTPADSEVPYMQARIFRSRFTYSFAVSPGWKFLRLYFYPTRYNSGFDAVTSFFSVTVNGFTLLRNFSADLTVKASEEHIVMKEFIIPVNQMLLNLTFTPSSPNSLAFVNGIEIVSMPDRFYSKGGLDDFISNVGSAVNFEIDNSTALESVHRVNVGGQMIGEVGDTGMFRRWLSDYDFVLGEASGVKPYVEHVNINYTKKTPAYVAPVGVYATSRSMGNQDNPNLNLRFNLTWLFTVDAGFNYLVRLHFCEIVIDVNGPGQRVFTILIENQIARLETDVFGLSGGYLTPMYLDFKVYVRSGIRQRPDLRLDLHPTFHVNSRYYDAILNGIEILKLNDPEGSLAGPNPIPRTSPTPNSVKQAIRDGNGKSNVMVIALAVVGSAVVLAMSVVVVVMLIKKRKSVNTTSKSSTSAISLRSALCRRFSILEIKSATNDFEEKLIVGVGGFGKVYKGQIDGGATLVAVKRLGISSMQGIKEFETELEMLSVLRHTNLVSLIGYCDDENEMMLVYEYMPRGTLNDHLYKRDKAIDPPFSWKQRLEICIGSARGLQYLHTRATHTIIHRDIKTTNILLDENYIAKVSDFGLSKFGPTSESQTHISTLVKGTFGYLDPEYFRRQVLTYKSDVYSFGVVLFEVLCCRPVRVLAVEPEKVNLIGWVKSHWESGTVDQIVDTDLTDDITPESLKKFCEIAERCVRDRGTERPSMNEVVCALEFALQLHETAEKNNAGGYTLNPPHGEVGTRKASEDDLFSRTT